MSTQLLLQGNTLRVLKNSKSGGAHMLLARVHLTAENLGKLTVILV